MVMGVILQYDPLYHGFNDIDEDNNVGKMGYFLAEPFQQKGIMSRAYNAVIDYGFETLGLNRIEAYIADGNERSKALLRRLDRKSIRLNSSHVSISYAVFCL